MVGAKVVYIEKDVGNKVYAAAAAAMHKAGCEEYREVILSRDAFARMQRQIKNARREH